MFFCIMSYLSVMGKGVTYCQNQTQRKRESKEKRERR